MMRTHAALLAALLLAPVALARPDPAPPPAPAPAPEKKNAPAPSPLPDLDELLGLPSSGSKPADASGAGTGAGALPPLPDAPNPASPDAIKTELQRKLADKAIDDNFKKAVQLMSDVAGRLTKGRDAGIDTQRTQEEIIRRLEALIESAKDRESKSKSSPQQQQGKEQSKPTPQQDQAKANNPGGKNNNAEMTPPALQTGALNKEALDAAVAAWGALPERVRESLLQGMGDKFSSLYDALTQEYYRRLAEEKPRE